MQRRQTLSSSLYSIDQTSEYLSASNLKIKQIDKLKQLKTSKIKVLNISNNLLTKLENVQQFANLQQIDIRNNIIKNGCELLVLRALANLTRVYVEGNPFLQEPLDQDVLEFLIQKQTDIEILSGQELNRILDLQEGQLKVVFLQNYLKKINCHDEILARRGNLQASRRSIRNQQNTNHLIINKIMPQFYSIIDNPKMKTKVKKQTIGIKRQEQVSFQDAVKIKKQKQQQQVNSLIKDILLLVQEQDQEKYQSSQYVEEVQKIKNSVDQGVQVDTVPYDGKDLNLWNTHDKFNSTESFRRKLQKIRNNINFNDSEIQTNRVNRMHETSRSPMQRNQHEKSVGRLNSPRVQDLFSPKNDSYSKSSTASPVVGKFTYNDNFYSFNNTRPMPFNESSSKPAKRPNQQQKFETKKGPHNESAFSQKYYYPQSTRRNEQKQQEQLHEQQMSQKPAAQLYQQYYAHLTKYNPTFALLYSQILTLSSQQKHVLIEALAKDHKNKTVQLFMQRNKVRNLKMAATQNASLHEKQRYQLALKMSELSESLHLCKQYNQKLEKENGRIVGLLKVLSEDMSDLKEENKKLKDGFQKKNKEVNNLNKDLRNRIMQLHNLDASEDIGESLVIAHNQRLKQQYFNIICKRAKQHTKITEWREKRQLNQRKKLLTISWSLLKKHLLVHILAKMKAKQGQNSILKIAFEQWKQSVECSKKIKQTQQQILQKIKKKNIKLFLSLIKRRIQGKKQRKLHNFWADHHIQKKYFYKLAKRVKESKLSQQQKQKMAISHNKKYKIAIIFRNICQLKAKTKFQTNAGIKKITDIRKDSLFQKLRKNLVSSYIKKERNQKIKAVNRILTYSLQEKQKKQFLRLLNQQKEQIKFLEGEIKKKKKFSSLNTMIGNIKQKKVRRQIRNKTTMVMKKMAWGRFDIKIRAYLKFLNRFKSMFSRIHRKDLFQGLRRQRKQISLQKDLKNTRIKQFFKNFIKNAYQSKLIQLQVKQRIQQQQTKELLQKMRSLQQMQLQAIQTQHNKQLQILEQQQIRKQIQYRNQVLDIENQKKQLQDKIWVMKKQIQNMRERQNLFFKEKQLIQEQVKIAQNGSKEMSQLNVSLQNQIQSMNVKYQRVLQLYTQALIHLEKKDKITENIATLEKERDKTVEKQKRHIGLAKNGGEFISLRSRPH